MTPPMDSIAVSGRPELMRILGRCVLEASPPQSFALVGLPGFMPEVALNEVLARVKTRDDVLFQQLKIGSRSPVEVVNELIAGLDGSLEGRSEGDLEIQLSRFRETAQSALAGRVFVLAIDDFHQLGELRKTAELEVLGMLDCWQAACTEGQWMRVVACSRVQPIGVCKSIGYSDFYKVFGIRVYCAGLLDANWQVLARHLLSDRDVTVSDAVLSELGSVSGGVPDFVVELLRFIENGKVTEGELTTTAALSEFFKERRTEMVRWLTPESRDFFEQEGWKQVTPVTRQWASECRRLGLLVERDGQLALPTPLLAAVHSDYSAESPDPGFVHGEYIVEPAQRSLVRKLCEGTFYTRLTSIQNLPNEAHVLYCTRETELGRQLPPRIIKIWSSERLEKERTNHIRAQDLLGGSCPPIIGFEKRGRHAGLLIEYACADNKYYVVHTFETLYQGHVEGKIDQIRFNPVDVVERLLGGVLAGLYCAATLKEATPADHYYLPAVKKSKDEIAMLSERAHETGVLDTDGGTLVVGAHRVPNPGTLIGQHCKTLFGVRVPMLICDPIHGDLNVRNFLVDGVGNIHVIDFSSLREGPLLKDFVRLESEVLFKLAPVQDITRHVGLLKALLEPDLIRSAERQASVAQEKTLATTLDIIAKIRKIALGYVREASIQSDYDFEADYLVGLTATTARLALFVNYLEKDQLAAALAYTGLAGSRLLEYRKRR